MSSLDKIVVSGRLLCDLEVMLLGGFSPLEGFLTEIDYKSVVNNMRLSSGELWPMPIVYKIKKSELSKYSDKTSVILADSTNLPLAQFHISDIYSPDLELECKNVYGTTDDNHPYVNEVLSDRDILYVGGRIERINLPVHFDFGEYRLTPEDVKSEIKKRGWTNVVGFQTRNPMHRSHMELTLKSLQEVDNGTNTTGVLIHPIVGITQACDVNYHTRVKCYKKIIERYPKFNGSDQPLAMLSLLPLSMRMAGPREAIWHALIRKNYGCTHFIVGRDHAGPSYKNKNGEAFYGPYDAHELVTKYSDEIGIKVVMSQMIVYLKSQQVYKPINEVEDKSDMMNISGTELRNMLVNREKIPEWFTFPEISQELYNDYLPNSKKGFCIYMVGLSGSGKTTLLNQLHGKLMELSNNRRISVLDGDVVRQELSKGLGFSREDRSLNVRRIGYVASEIVKHGGICMCANIAPYQEDRDHNRSLIETYGGYYETHVNTKIDECEKRDCKGLYKLARQGVIKEFTGVSDPFECPENPEFTFESNTVEDFQKNIDNIASKLRNDGYID